MPVLTLIKGPDTHVFSYEYGDEQAVIGALVDAVHDPARKFDWFDAAVLSHQIGQQLAKSRATIGGKAK